MNKKWCKYGHLPPKEAEYILWHTACVDLIGPYTICSHKGDQKLMCMMMIDPAMGWFEITEVPYLDDLVNKSSAQISQIFNNTWLAWYPRPVYCIYDNSSKFKLHFRTLCVEYGIH